LKPQTIKNEDMMRAGQKPVLNFLEDLHKRLKIATIEQGVTAGEIIEQLIAKHRPQICGGSCNA